MTGTPHVMVERMWERIGLARDDSDTAFFHDLMYMGELLTKLIVVSMTSFVGDDRERQRYAIEHTLVRANSIGEWVQQLDDLLTGPPSQLLATELTDAKRDLTQRFGADETTWQRASVDCLNRAATCLDPSAEQLPAKVSLQRWFQTFASLRNRTRGHGAPTGLDCSTMATDLERSIRLIVDNFVMFNTPWVYLRRNLSGKYRVTPICGDSSPFDHLKSSDSAQLTDGVYIYVDGATSLNAPLLYTDAELSNFFVANGNYRNTGFEALSYLTNDISTVDATLYAVPAASLPASGTAALPALDLIGDTFSNLPPPITDYVERSDLEAELNRLLDDDRHPIVTLVGRGGVGKTSLALEVLHQIARTNRVFGIIWFSARDIDLLPTGPKRVAADVLSQEDLAAQFVELMNPPGSANRHFDDLDFFAKAMSGALPEGPFIFVFDNFETVRNPADVYNWIDTSIRLPNKVLITTRIRDFRADYPVEVRGMSREQFELLASSSASRLGIEKLVTPDVIDKLYDESDGHPYIVKVLLGEVAVTHRVGSVERLMVARDDILDALFERTLVQLSPAAQRVFLTLCSWRSIVPRLAVEAALLRPSNEFMDVGKALDVLERSSLIEMVGGDDADQFIRVPLAAGVFGRRKLTVSSMKSVIEADSDVIRLFGAAQLHEATKGLDPRIDQLVRATARQLQDGADIADNLGVLEFIARHYSPAWLKIAQLMDEYPDPEEGLRRAAAALNLYLEQNPDDYGAWQRLAHTSARLGDALGELHALMMSVRSRSASVAAVSQVANRFNALAAQGRLPDDQTDRRALAVTIRGLMEDRVPELDATGFSRLAWICLQMQDVTQAEGYTRQGLLLEPYNQYCIRLSKHLNLK